MSNYDKAVRAADMAQPETAKAYAILALVDAIRNTGKPTPVPMPRTTGPVFDGLQRPPWSQQ